MLTLGLEANHSCGLTGLMSLKPPSPLLTDCQDAPYVVDGEETFLPMLPLSWVPASRMLASAGLCENHTAWIMEPMVPLRLSYWIQGAWTPLQVWVRVSKPLSVR